MKTARDWFLSHFFSPAEFQVDIFASFKGAHYTCFRFVSMNELNENIFDAKKSTN